MSGSELSLKTDFDNLYNDHHQWLLGVLRRRLGCFSSAEDMSHDVFVRLLGKSDIPQFREPRAYLASVANGLIIDLHRRKQVEQAWLEVMAVQAEGEAVPSAEQQVIMIDALTRIDALLDKLHPRVRRVFIMSRLEGIAYADIAQQLNVSLSTVQKDMTKAIRHCYQVLMT